MNVLQSQVQLLVCRFDRIGILSEVTVGVHLGPGADESIDSRHRLGGRVLVVDVAACGQFDGCVGPALQFYFDADL